MKPRKRRGLRNLNFSKACRTRGGAALERFQKLHLALWVQVVMLQFLAQRQA